MSDQHKRSVYLSELPLDQGPKSRACLFLCIFKYMMAIESSSDLLNGTRKASLFQNIILTACFGLRRHSSKLHVLKFPHDHVSILNTGNIVSFTKTPINVPRRSYISTE